MAHTSVCAGVGGRERRNNFTCFDNHAEWSRQRQASAAAAAGEGEGGSPDSGAGSEHKRETWAM